MGQTGKTKVTRGEAGRMVGAAGVGISPAGEVLDRFAALPDLEVPDGVEAAMGDDGFRVALAERWNGYRTG